MNLPDPAQYSDWKEFVNQLILVLNEEDITRLLEDKDEAIRRAVW